MFSFTDSLNENRAPVPPQEEDRSSVPGNKRRTERDKRVRRVSGLRPTRKMFLQGPRDTEEGASSVGSHPGRLQRAGGILVASSRISTRLQTDREKGCKQGEQQVGQGTVLPLDSR